MALCVCVASLLASRPVCAETKQERARTLFQQGLEHYQAGRLDKALQQLQQAWRLVPSPELAFNVARVYERMGEARQGISLLPPVFEGRQGRTCRASPRASSDPGVGGH